MKTPVLIAIIALACIKSSAQDDLMDFNPLPIGKELKAKPFYKSGVLFEVTDVKFINDTNYFTLYIVNNSAEPLWLLTIEGSSVHDIVLYNIPENFVPYQPILKLDEQGATCGNSYYTKELKPGYYLKDEIKAACPGCTKADKRLAKFILSSHPHFYNFEEPVATHQSNAFEVYYNKTIFDEYNTPFYIKNPSEKKQKELIIGQPEGFFVKIDSAVAKKTHPYTTIGGYASPTLSVDSLQKVAPVIAIYKDNLPYAEYEILSAQVILMPKKGEMQLFNQTGPQMSNDFAERLQLLKPGDIILIDQIKVKGADGLRNLAPVVYTIQ